MYPHPGCHIFVPKETPDLSGPVTYPVGVLGNGSLEDEDDEMPDLSVDPDDGTLSVFNQTDHARTYYVTISDCSQILIQGATGDMVNTLHNRVAKYSTFILLVPGQHYVDVCQVVPVGCRLGQSLSARHLELISIESDIQDYVPHVPSEHPFNLDIFPLSSSPENTFLCTQSSAGTLTHFAHPSTYHAVDFQCPVGTPVVAIFDCEIVEIRNDSTNSGTRVSDLFNWNSIMIKSTNGSVFCEFVHIRKDSMRFAVGDKASAGEVICESADVGFCPEPHLHMEIHYSQEPGTDSVPIHWKDSPFAVGQRYP